MHALFPSRLDNSIRPSSSRSLDTMSQDHHHPHSHSSHSRSWNPFSRLTTTQRIAAVIAIATALLITEVVIGFRNRSLALVADAFHITSDLIGYIVALVAVRMGIAGKVSPAKYSFGYQRAALLGGFFNGGQCGAARIRSSRRC